MNRRQDVENEPHIKALRRALDIQKRIEGVGRQKTGDKRGELVAIYCIERIAAALDK